MNNGFTDKAIEDFQKNIRNHNYMLFGFVVPDNARYRSGDPIFPRDFG